MTSTRKPYKSIQSFNYPKTKSKNVTCVHCKHRFSIRGEILNLRGQQVPLLLKCGHSICYGCTVINYNKPCPLCKVSSQNGETSSEQYPLSIYALGLVVIGLNQPVYREEPDISFYYNMSTRLKYIQAQGTCYECEVEATFRCPQCNVLFCQACYVKIHGKALQNHTKIKLNEATKDLPFKIGRTCSDTCQELLGYYCQDCQICSCSHCMLRLHSKHNHVTLQERNQEMMKHFYEVYNKVGEALQRIQHMHKKVKTMRMSSAEMRDYDSVEAKVTQHFAHLHGVLQNIERTMIDKIYEHRASYNKNLEDLETRLNLEEDRLQATLIMAANAKDNLEKIDINEVVCKLKEIADVPCHLVQEPVLNDERIMLVTDKSIIDTLEKHCELKMPSISEFNLLKTELLPDNYQVESLQREIAIPTGGNSSSNKNNFVTQDEESSTIEIFSSSKNCLETSVNSICYNQLGPVTLVKVMNVYDPSMFYVQMWSNQKQAEELSRDLQESSRTAPRPTQEITVGKMYMVEYTRDKEWERGRVTKVNYQEDEADTYDILCVDSGYLVRNVSINSLRVLSPKHASVPILAIKCSLYDVVSSSPHWSKLAVDEFRKLAKMYTPLSMHIFYTSGNTHYVDLCLCSDGKQENVTSMRETLVFMEHAKYVSRHQLSRTNPLSIHKYFQEELELERYFDMAVQHVVSPDCIYVTKLGANQKYINKLMMQMTAFYNQNASCHTLTCPLEIGTPCAFLHLNGMWYRGLITKITDEDSIKVFCVDFGYCFDANYESLRRLTINYITSRCQAIKVSLKDLEPLPNNQNIYPGWSSHTIDFTTKYLTNQRVRVIAMNKKDDTYGVYLYIHGKINFNSFLASKNLANIVGSTISAVKSKKRRSKQKRGIKKNVSLEYNMKDIEKALTKQMADPDPFKVRVQIHKALSPDHIYVSDLSREEESIQLITKMQDFYTKYHSKGNISLTIDSVYAIYNCKDKRYFRGRILKFISDQEVLVLFYDMALEEIISIKDIQPLHISFQQEPAYVFKVKLAGILPCGDSGMWPSSSCQKLIDIIAENHNCQFYITKVNDPNYNSKEIPVQLWVKQSHTNEPLSPTKVEINSVNKMLVEAGLALPIKGYKEKEMDKTLAIEFKRQLQEMQEMQVTIQEEDIKWLSTEEETLKSPNISFEGEVFKSISNINDSMLPLQNLTDWLPALPITNDNFIAIPTSLDHDTVLYLHPKNKGKQMLEYIEKTLTDFYNEVDIRPCDEEWTEGDICVAQYHANKKWYRGKVTKILDIDKIEVQFVDYGNKEECAIGTVKKRIILGHIPIQCTECLIHGLHPENEEGKWDIEDLDKIHLLLVEKDCKVTVLQRQDTRLIISITLLNPKECDLISYLVNELGIRLAPISSNNSKILNNTYLENISINSFDAMIDNFTMEDTNISEANIESEMIMENATNTDHVISGSSMLMRNLEDNCEDNLIESLNNTEIITKEAAYSTPEVISVENLTAYVPLIIPKSINSFEVELCYSEKPTIHYTQLGQNIESKELYNYYVQYHAIMKDIQKCAPQQPLIKILAPNTPCCAKFMDNIWYRTIIQTADVVENTNEVRVQLYYVDFGNSEDRQVVLEKSDLRTLKEEWLIVPTMLITCHLYRVSIPKNVDFLELAEELKEMYETCNKSTIVKIKERYKTHLEVELYVDKTCKKLLYQSLIERGFLKIKKTKED